MPTEIYNKPNPLAGRRLRKITAAATVGLKKLNAALYSSLGMATPVAPAGPVALVLTGTTAAGDVLTVVPGTFTGTPTPVVVRVWKRGGTPIAGESATTYTLVGADSGLAITVTETATNSAGNVSATSNSITAA